MLRILMVVLVAGLGGCTAMTPMTPEQLEEAPVERLWNHRKRLNVDLFLSGDWQSQEEYRKALVHAAGRGYGWPEDETERIAEGHIWTGMEKSKLQWAAPPYTVREERTPSGRYETWGYPQMRIYLRDEKVEWWHIRD